MAKGGGARGMCPLSGSCGRKLIDFPRAAGSEDLSGEDKERTLYTLLGVKPDATESEIKKAYFRLARDCHPDKRPDDPNATERFQQLQRCKDCLLDEKKRKIYDQTGEIPGEDGAADLSGKSFEELYEYYRAIYAAVTEQDVKEWEHKYPGGHEEREDLESFYNRFGGDMRHVCDHIPFCEKEDLWRIKGVVDKMIADGVLAATDMYAKFRPKKLSPEEVAAIKRAREPEEGWAEAEGELKAKKKGGMGDLFALIQARQGERAGAFDALTASLEAKYGGSKAKKPKGGNKNK